jgi:hypothetical protein
MAPDSRPTGAGQGFAPASSFGLGGRVVLNNLYFDFKIKKQEL